MAAKGAEQLQFSDMPYQLYAEVFKIVLQRKYIIRIWFTTPASIPNNVDLAGPKNHILKGKSGQ